MIIIKILKLFHSEPISILIDIIEVLESFINLIITVIVYTVTDLFCSGILG